MKVNIIARTNGVGLDRDVDLISKALTTAGDFDITVSSCRANGKLRKKKHLKKFDVTVSHYRSISPFRRIFPYRQRYDANIFLERVYPRWFGSAEQNFLIPNQEHFPHRLLGNLKHIDHILCKSKHAEEIFSQHSNSTHFTGFTSTDLIDESVRPDYQSFFHLAGRSTQKGTDTILALWGKNPAWPLLTILQCKENAPSFVPKNVRLITDYIPHEEIKRHLNSHGIHLCTSSSEGWGHYIVEAMSCRALVVTTDGPPMNEIISPERGVLAPWHRQEPRHLGTDWHVDPNKLEQLINELLLMPQDQKQRYGEHARTWFEENDTRFNQCLPETIGALIAD